VSGLFSALEDYSFTDEAEIRSRWWKIAPGDVVLDVGAGVGSYTIPALADNALVVAFAPERDTRAILCANIARNDGFAERCQVLPYGLYSQRGFMHLEKSGDRYRFTVEREDETDLEVCPLDGLGERKVDWIKIDVEGAEVEVLRGAENTIRQHRPRMIIENHLFMDPNIGCQVREFISSLCLGYHCETVPWHSVSHSFFEVR
jgi:FkbM family methyltransferase